LCCRPSFPLATSTTAFLIPSGVDTLQLPVSTRDEFTLRVRDGTRRGLRHVTRTLS
jgi:hypothetical protein